jgi:hypothetical protein
MSNEEDVVKAATVARFRQIATAYESYQQSINWHQAEIVRLQGEQATLSQQAQRCYATAELFGFDLVAASAASASASGEVAPSAGATASLTMTVSRSLTVKDFILSEAQQAHPNPVRASELRKKLEAQGLKLHEKTVGMSLYRLSQERMVERRGKADWYFVPESERQAPAGDGGEGPGDEPGLLLAAE